MPCPKCHGFILTQYGESFCLNCSYREGDLNRQVGREGFESDTPETRCCAVCREQPRLRHRTLCRTCLYKNAARMRAKRDQARG